MSATQFSECVYSELVTFALASLDFWYVLHDLRFMSAATRPCLEAASIAFRLEARIDRDADIFRVCHYGIQVQKGIEVWLGGF